MPRKAIYGKRLEDRLSVSLPREQRQKIKQLAQRQHRPVANVLRMAIEEYLRRHQEELEENGEG